jgi:RNA polymerase sigma-70 factor (ECF subfamily)
MKASRPAPSGSPVRPEDEESLLGQCRAGDTQAFRILVQRYQDRAYGLALRLLRSEPDAEEVTQDAFVRAWRALADFRGDSSFGTWLYRIVWRRAVDRAAVMRTRREREESLDARSESAGDSRSGSGAGRGEPAAVVQEGAARDNLDEWERLTESLTEAQRAVVTMFYYEDMSVKDVARALEMPEGTVKTHLSRARATLRAKFGAPASAAAPEARENDDAL